MMETTPLRGEIRWQMPILVGLTLVGAVWLATNLRLLSIRIDQPDIGLDYAMGILWWVVIAIGLACVKGEDQPLLLKAWLVKFFVVLVFMLFYEQRYGLDANWYFKVTVTGEHPFYPGIDWREEWLRLQDAERLKEQYKIGEGTANMIRLTMLVATFTGPFYSALKVVFSFFGLLGAWAFYRAVVVSLGRPVPVAFYCLAFFPSILFWSSILGKDPVIFMCLGLCAYGVARTFVQGDLMGMPIVAVGLFLTFQVRSWTALMAGGTLALTLFFRRRVALQRWALILLTIPALLYGWDPVKKAFHIEDLTSINKLFIELTEGQNVKSEWTSYQAEFGGGQRTAGAEEVVEKLQSGDVGGALPIIIFSGLFRPLPFDARNGFMIISGLENTFLLFLVLLAIKRFKWTYIQEPLVTWPIFFSLLWAAFYGAVLLANFGAGVRYKLQVLPFMVVALFMVLHPQGLSFRTGDKATKSEIKSIGAPGRELT